MDLLKDLLHFHPVMKAAVVREVRQLIHKQAIGKIHAVFTSVVFLSQSVTDASSAVVVCLKGEGRWALACWLRCSRAL